MTTYERPDESLPYPPDRRVTNDAEKVCHCGQCEGIRGGYALTDLGKVQEWRAPESGRWLPEPVRFDPSPALGWCVLLLIVGALFGLLVALMLEVAP